MRQSTRHVDTASKIDNMSKTPGFQNDETQDHCRNDIPTETSQRVNIYDLWHIHIHTQLIKNKIENVIVYYKTFNVVYQNNYCIA